MNIKEIRKVQKTGRFGATYNVSIPKSVCKFLQLESNDLLIFKQEGNKIVLEKIKE